MKASRSFGRKELQQLPFQEALLFQSWVVVTDPCRRPPLFTQALMTSADRPRSGKMNLLRRETILPLGQIWWAIFLPFVGIKQPTPAIASLASLGKPGGGSVCGTQHLYQTLASIHKTRLQRFCAQQLHDYHSDLIKLSIFREGQLSFLPHFLPLADLSNGPPAAFTDQTSTQPPETKIKKSQLPPA